MKKTIIIFLLLSVVLLSHVQGSENPARTFRYGVGFQRLTWNCWGISVMLDITPKFSVEVLVGLIGDRQAYGFRGLFRFFRIKNINLYGYGQIGTEKVTEWGAEEYGLQIGTGGGVEYNLDHILGDVISFGIHVEMGVENLSGYVVINANYTTFIYSAGFHIRY